MKALDAKAIYMVAAQRTATGAMLGQFSEVAAPTLGSVALRACLDTASVDPNSVQQVWMGCVLQAGIGQAPARQAALLAKLPVSTSSTTINKMCGSGLQAVMLAADLLRTGQAQCALAGGMESMTNAPYLLPNARKGFRLGHAQCVDHLFIDGLEDAYEHKLMGCYAERCASQYHFSRQEQDAFAIESVRRAQEAIAKNLFADEIAPVEIIAKGQKLTLSQDEPPSRCYPEKIPTLKPVFQADGTVTAANSSSIADGAAALLLMTGEELARQGKHPIARILGQVSFAQAPEDFTTAPIGAIASLLKQTALTANQIDLWEINEAFAVVTMAAIRDLHLSPDRVNIRGGACALGHPIGASGARILVTLLHALRAEHKSLGIAALCIGGGEAVAMAVELCE